MKRFLFALTILALTVPLFGHVIIRPPHPHPWPHPRPRPVRPELKWSITSHDVDIKVRHQVASVVSTQTVVNQGSGMIEVQLMFPVPAGAAIKNLTLMVDGKEFAGKLLDAKAARATYEEIVRRRKDPALLEYVGMGMFKTSAFPLLPNKPAKIQIAYTTLCKKDANCVEVGFPLGVDKLNSKAIGEVTVTADIKGEGRVPMVYSPTHDLTVNRKAPNHVVASWTAKNVLPLSDFTVYYQDTGDELGASILLYPNADPKQAGYFLMLLSPNFKPATNAKPAPKDIVIVLDKSGSMSGKKIRQACEAATYILKRLNPEDRFNIIPYSDTIEPSFKTLQPASEKMVKEGVEAVDEIQASGGTNIAEALATARKQFDPKSKRPKYILFLTDGLPTVGKTDTKEIIKHIAAAADDGGQRMFVFGVGYDVNVRLLDKLAIAYKGRSDYVKPNEPVERKVTSMYNKIRNPLLTNLKAVMPNSMKCSEMYPRDLGDLYDGDQIVVAGRCRYVAFSGEVLLVLTATAPGGKAVTFKYSNPTKKLARGEFIARLWATRRIGFLLDQIQLNGENKELTEEVVKLSKEYGILTPYTSFLADDSVNLASNVRIQAEGRRRLGSLARTTTGESAQRAAKSRGSLNDSVGPMAPAAKSAPATMRPGDKMGRSGGVVIAGNTNQKDYEADKKESVSNMRQVGNQAIYQRGKLWIAANASHLDPKKDESKIKTLKQYSDEYFALTRANTRSENAILASQMSGEELMVTLRGQAYRIIE